MSYRAAVQILRRVATAFILGAIAALFAVVLIVTYSNEIRQSIFENIIIAYIDKTPAFRKKVVKLYQNDPFSSKSDSAQSEKRSYPYERVSTDILTDLQDFSITPAIGSLNPEIIVVEFFDYSCPFCKIGSGIYRDVLEKEKNKLLWIFRDYPILGPISVIAARAALASAKQGKYIEFHYEMMAISGPLTEKAIFQAAQRVGINVEILKRDMNLSEIDQQLAKNKELANKIGVRGTPTLVVNSFVVHGLVERDMLYKIMSDQQKPNH